MGPHNVAFTRGNGSLYVARRPGPERLVARHEYPVGWTRAGRLVTGWWRHGSATLRSRGPAGRLIRTLARHVRWSTFDSSTRTVLYVDADGRLARTAGAGRVVLASLPALAAGRLTSLDALGHGLVGLVGRNRIVVLREQGSVYARAVMQEGPRRLTFPTGGPVVASGGNAVVFAASWGNDGYASSGVERILELRPGDARARTLSTIRYFAFAICERGVDLSWHGRWVLYSSSEGRVVAIDPAGLHAAVDLSRAVTRLPGAGSEDGGHATVRVAWAPDADALWLEPPLPA